MLSREVYVERSVHVQAMSEATEPVWKEMINSD